MMIVNRLSQYPESGLKLFFGYKLVSRNNSIRKGNVWIVNVGIGSTTGGGPGTPSILMVKILVLVSNSKINSALLT